MIFQLNSYISYLLWSIAIFLIVITVIITVLIVINFLKIISLPENSPRNYLKKISSLPQSELTKKKSVRIVCIGDSITHGHVGENYVKILEQSINKKFRSKYKEISFDFINAGINSELAYNVLQRLNEIIECKPDIITIMIGTNDANGTYNSKVGKRHVRQQKLPEYPSLNFYSENLREILKRLKKETESKIAVISIPTIGEDENDPSYNFPKEFIKEIKNLVTEFEIFYIPFHEKMEELLKSIDISEHNDNNKENHKLIPKYPYKYQTMLMVLVLFKHYLFKQPYDKIAQKHGFYYHVDYLHLNQKAALILTKMLENFIESEIENILNNKEEKRP